MNSEQVRAEMAATIGQANHLSLPPSQISDPMVASYSQALRTGNFYFERPPLLKNEIAVLRAALGFSGLVTARNQSDMDEAARILFCAIKAAVAPKAVSSRQTRRKRKVTSSPRKFKQ